jgi:hypothetical protein
MAGSEAGSGFEPDPDSNRIRIRIRIRWSDARIRGTADPRIHNTGQR